MPVTVVDLIGPQLTTAQMTALGGQYAAYDPQFSTASDTLHANAAPGLPDTYYDAALAHYAAAERIRAANPARAAVYEARGDALAVYMRNLWIAPQMTTVFTAFPMGVAIHYLRTGDAASLTAVKNLARAMWYAWGQKAIYHAATDMNDYWDQRTIGRAIECFLVAYLFNVSSVSGADINSAVFTGTTGSQTITEGVYMDPSPAWDAIVRQMVKYAWNAQQPNGSWLPWTYGYVQANFNAGILLNILLDVDRFLPGIPQLRPMVHSAVNFLATQWHPTGFNYASGVVYPNNDHGQPPEGDTTPAPDLTGLIVSPVAWAAMNGSASVNPALAATIFAQTVTGADVSAGKQFNQAYAKSYRAPSLLSVTPAGITVLAFDPGPVGVVVDQPFSCTVKAVDRDSRAVVTSFTKPVRLFIAIGRGQLTGVTTVNAVAGVATFTGLRLRGTRGPTELAASAEV